MKKFKLAAIAVLAASLCLTGCGGASNSNSASYKEESGAAGDYAYESYAGESYAAEETAQMAEGEEYTADGGSTESALRAQDGQKIVYTGNLSIQTLEYDKSAQKSDAEIDVSKTKQPYESLAPDFFDLIIVDECHRGSVRDDSEWKRILEYFSSATQIGMTATPKSIEGADNLDYFCKETNGEPLYIYSLAQGIADGFLAPYRVTQSFLNIDLEGWKPEPDEKDLPF